MATFCASLLETHHNVHPGPRTPLGFIIQNIITGLCFSRTWLPLPGAQLLPSGDQKILVFSYKSFTGYPGFYRFRALGSLQFSLEHSLVPHLRPTFTKFYVRCEAFQHYPNLLVQTKSACNMTRWEIQANKTALFF